MSLPAFKIEEYLAPLEFSTKYNICCSDIEALTITELLEYADNETLSLWQNLKLSYTETAGHPLLRIAAAEVHNLPSLENIICFAGAEEAIYCFMHTMLTADDHVIAITPGYQSLVTIPQSICAVTTVELQAEQEWQLNIAEVAQAIQANTKAIILNFPHNPTGAHLSLNQQQQIISLARKNNLLILADEVYSGLELQGESLPSFASLYEHAFSLNVMSKSYGLPGLRIGWLASQDQESLQQVLNYKLYTSICNSAPAEILSIIALRARDQIIANNKLLLQNNLIVLEQFFAEYPDVFHYIAPQAGCICFPKYLGGDVEQFAQDLLTKAQVLIIPGTVFDHPGNHFRISIARKDLEQGLGAVHGYLKNNALT